MKTLKQLKGIFGNIVIVVLLFACTNQSPEYIRYKKTIGKNINLDMFENAFCEDNVFSLDEIRKKYEFISIVYLQENCKSCYKKFITWHKEMKRIAKIYSVESDLAWIQLMCKYLRVKNSLKKDFIFIMQILEKQ
ncbi:MAG: hypothetical protein CR996_00840 [Draconibacterium sp.]|nr:MAG: hypothetical protein CR996_00840 [Draconibacterium sp.]